MKDLLQITTALIAVIGGLIAAFKAVYEIRLNREHRKMELRWRQANLARQILDDAFASDYFTNAMLMLDSSGRKYKIDEGIMEPIYYEDIIAALSEKTTIFSDKPVYIRDCFDYFFFYLNRIEQFVETNLIFIDDIRYPFSFYAKKMMKDQQVFESYMKENEFDYALNFFRRLGFH